MGSFAILRLDCSPKRQRAHSARFADELVRELTQRHLDATETKRDLAADPPAFVDADFAADMMVYTQAVDATTHASLRYSETLITELDMADAVVIATPMHNFSVPAVLKAWVDQVVRFGRTFNSTPDGKVGLLKDRPVYVVVSTGGYVTGELATQPDFLTPYLTAVFQTIGITSISFIYLEAASRSDEQRDKAFSSAREQLKAALG